MTSRAWRWKEDRTVKKATGTEKARKQWRQKKEKHIAHDSWVMAKTRSRTYQVKQTSGWINTNQFEIQNHWTKQMGMKKTTKTTEVESVLDQAHPRNMESGNGSFTTSSCGTKTVKHRTPLTHTLSLSGYFLALYSTHDVSLWHSDWLVNFKQDQFFTVRIQKQELGFLLLIISLECVMKWKCLCVNEWNLNPLNNGNNWIFGRST